MAGDIKGQWDCYVNHSGNAFQAVVDVVAGVTVGASLVESGV